MRFFIIFCFLFFVKAVLAQEDSFPDLKGDKESFDKLRDQTIRAELAVFTLDEMLLTCKARLLILTLKCTIMKRSLFTTILGFSVVFGFSQHNYTPPKKVSESFQKEYPRSKPSKWSQSSEGWSVSFQDNDHNNGEATAYFDKSGKHVETHIPYDQNDVPVSVRNHTRDSYGASDQYDYTRIERSGEKAVYKTQVNHKKSEKTIYMDNDGHEKEYHEKHY